jgi:hypothetical protein
VLVDRLECGIVRDSAVVEGETLRMSDTLGRERRVIRGDRSRWQHNASENGGKYLHWGDLLRRLAHTVGRPGVRAETNINRRRGKDYRLAADSSLHLPSAALLSPIVISSPVVGLNPVANPNWRLQ